MSLVPLSEILRDRGREIAEVHAARARGEVVLTHVPTGLARIDRTFGGAEMGSATLVMGHSGDGKTSLLAAVCRGAAEAGCGVLAFHLEDPRRRLADRHYAQLTGEAAHRIARGDHAATDPVPVLRDAYAAAEPWARRVAVWNGDAGHRDVLRAIRETPDVAGARVRLVVVDYLQRFSASEDGLEAVCAELTRDVGRLAEERQLAVLLASQVRSQVVDRGRTRFDRSGQVDGFRPGRGDCMWSRRVEQFVRAEWVVFRPERWRRECGLPEKPDDRLELHVVKASYGPEGIVSLGWDGPRARVVNLE